MKLYLKTKLLLAFIFIATTHPIFSCTIFIANDNKNVWVGNNEDDNPNKNYRMWFVPSSQKNENGYILWGGLLTGLQKMFSDKFPEGGINEYGLFIDAAALPEKIKIKKNNTKEDWKGYVIKDILKKCQTVQEAISCLSQYNLIEQEKAQIFLADASGDYAIVHANYIITKKSQNFVLSNYCLNDSNQHLCWRRSIVEDLLKSKIEYALDDIKLMMEKSTQTDFGNKTNYSIAADLKQGTIHIFNNRDFSTDLVMNVKQELKKGEREADMVDLFPKNIALDLDKKLNKDGLESALTWLDQLKKSNSKTYNFKNNDVVNYAIELLGKGKLKEAIAFLKYVNEYQPENLDAKLWLGIALKKENLNNPLSTEIFSELVQKQPQNYLTNLYGNQHQDSVYFKLDHFEDAKTVFLAGDFTEWKTKAIEMKKVNNIWSCTAPIPKGEHQYKYIVNDIWVTDPKNKLTGTLDKNTNSKLIVW